MIYGMIIVKKPVLHAKDEFELLAAGSVYATWITGNQDYNSRHRGS